ncbi:hypothetical protein COCSUDRAFT_40367 [Coccomyxa subellipsoidea C-169]|uniref:Uncharacterized protein n=1 Tax=Coccomyxa subellipsoidea (strain C-169) TaxID=574566 RepID=I0Z2Y1_COCSC|nr:hypothetical protein COCSUDRAFT_40367 [Coccomyxa subellipsoidea C-169]EIE25000.1 hypothetical protein COCSUDRAFT_40367 [Coccomyxa subellipsoidea C-169]|eukprot:XP_005649544.1 hypothetical protein COCSUDRAFT_40367 [Coccomyxa subellipsoidea C-169]
MAISSEERSGAMKTVIEGEQLQLEMMQLLQITRPFSGRQEDYDNMVKCLVKLFKICLLQGEVYIIPELSYEDASTRERITDKAKRINSAMQMLIALPLFSLKADDRDESGGTALALVALEALKRTDVDWDSILQRHGLTAVQVETVMRMALAHGLTLLGNRDNLPSQINSRVVSDRGSNVRRMKEISPSENWPWTSHYAASYQLNIKRDPVQAYRELLPGLRCADEQNNELKATPLRLMQCQLMLINGSRPDKRIRVSTFLECAKKAKDGVKLLDSWGEFRCRKTGILLPLHVKYLAEADGY